MKRLRGLLLPMLTVVALLTCLDARADKLGSDSEGRRASTLYPDDPAAYYRTLQRARGLFNDGKSKEALVLFRDLTGQFADDGETWLLLGHCQARGGDWQAAARSWREALALGAFPFDLGVDRNEPLVVNPNDLMLEIARAYAATGAWEEASAWLEKSLTARYDERYQLTEDRLLAPLEEKSRSAGLSPEFVTADDRRAGWHGDLDFLRNEMQRLHPDMYHASTRQEFDSAFAELTGRIEDLSDASMTAEVGRLLGLLGNGHNLLLPFTSEHAGLPLMPFVFYWFSDGLYIIDAETPYRQWIGARVDRFDATPLEQALDGMDAYIGHDNAMTLLWFSALFLASPHVLEVMSIIDDATAFTLHVTDPSGTPRQIDNPELVSFKLETYALRPLHDSKRTPLYLQHYNIPFWTETIDEYKLAYVQVNDIQNMGDRSIVEFADGLRSQVDKNGSRYLVLDLRHNAGGNGYLSMGLVRLAAYFEMTRGQGSVFVLMGRNTYSAAHNLLVDIDRLLTGVVLVGEPTGSRPNALAESGYFRLPYSGLMGFVSSQYQQHSWPEDHRIWLAPHVPVALSSKDYFAGRDPSLETVIRIIADGGQSNL